MPCRLVKRPAQYKLNRCCQHKLNPRRRHADPDRLRQRHTEPLHKHWQQKRRRQQQCGQCGNKSGVNAQPAIGVICLGKCLCRRLITSIADNAAHLTLPRLCILHGVRRGDPRHFSCQVHTHIDHSALLFKRSLNPTNTRRACHATNTNIKNIQNRGCGVG